MKKKTFLKNDDKNNTIVKHLRFIITEPDPEQNILAVNLTTLRNTGREDMSCIILPGEHSFIRKESYIAYKYAEELSIIKILQQSMESSIIFMEDINQDLLIRVQNGAKISLLLPVKFRKYFEHF
ncbi:MAG: hypothetical protein ABUK01_18940 [Leptospirales bacterium]